MINPFKNFSKKKIGGLLLIFVIIIAFGFGGFGGEGMAILAKLEMAYG